MYNIREGVAENEADGVSPGQIMKAKSFVPYLVDKQQHLTFFL